MTGLFKQDKILEGKIEFEDGDQLQGTWGLKRGKWVLKTGKVINQDGEEIFEFEINK